ncbi:hypothetical protein V8G54_014407 [Vigna mungo]|uniref:Uncharacterized protein n=1 Tax=Vigna mungo TaxID=3915 RepID=A0AAQ3NJU0_VIGMU
MRKRIGTNDVGAKRLGREVAEDPKLESRSVRMFHPQFFAVLCHVLVQILDVYDWHAQHHPGGHEVGSVYRLRDDSPYFLQHIELIHGIHEVGTPSFTLIGFSKSCFYDLRGKSKSLATARSNFAMTTQQGSSSTKTVRSDELNLNYCYMPSALGLKGWVRNRKDGSVDAVQEMEQRCQRGPPDVLVTGIQGFPSDDDPEVVNLCASIVFDALVVYKLCMEKNKYSTTVSNDSDMHDDFKPANKLEGSGISLAHVIEQDVKDNLVMVYMKGVPDLP